MNHKQTCWVNGYSLTCNYLWHAAKAQIKAAQTVRHPRESHFLACRVMCAFTLEAYLNHVGSIVEPTVWTDERGFFSPRNQYPGTKGKIDFLVEHAAFTMNKQDRPYTTLCELLSFRDVVAHGRTEWISEDVKCDRKGFPSFPISLIKREMTWALVEKALQDTQSFIESFHAHLRLRFPEESRLHPDPLGPILGHQQATMESTDEESREAQARLEAEIEQALARLESDRSESKET